jgi:hypothetical protein
LVAGRARNGKFAITVKASDAWAGRGMYALATVFRSGTRGTSVAGPARVMGAAYFDVSGRERGYPAVVELLGDAQRGTISTNDQFSFRVCIAQPSKDCTENARAVTPDPYPEAYAVAFIVDEGLLSLTGHHSPPPDPKNFFHGKTRIGLRIMDNYGRLLLKEGGDRPSRLALSNYTSSKIVSLAHGPQRLENGRTDFLIPKLELQNGTASILVIVWSKDYATAATTSVTVRSRVVADLSVPTFAFGGDRLILPLRLQNIDFSHEGEYTVRIAASNLIRRVSIEGRSPTAATGPQTEFRETLKIGEGPKTIYLAVDTPSDARGTALIDVHLEPVGSAVRLRGYPLRWSFDLRPPVLSSVETASFPITSQTQNLNKIVDDLVVGSYDLDTVQLKFHFAGNSQSLLMGSLDRSQSKTRPTVENLVSEGLLILHSDAGANSSQARQNVQRIIGEILSLQLPEGSFAPYRTIGDPSLSERNFTMGEEGKLVRSGLLRTTAVLDFLWLAKKAAYDVPDSGLRVARHFIETHQDYESQSCTFDALYTSRVLVDLGRYDHARIAQIERCTFDTLAERAAAASVLASFGRVDRAQFILQDAQKSTGAKQLEGLGDLRLAMMMSFLLDAGAPKAIVDEVAKIILVPAKGTNLSPSAKAWLSRAAAKAGTSESKIEANDVRISGMSLPLVLGRNGTLESETLKYNLLKPIPTTIRASANREVLGLITIEGTLSKAGNAKRLPDGALKRRYFAYNSGRELNLGVDPVAVGDRIVVMLEGGQQGLKSLLEGGGGGSPEDNPPLLIADLLPSAFKVVSTTSPPQTDLPRNSPLGQLETRGDLRSIETDPDRWLALIIPESRRVQREQNTPEGEQILVDQKLRPTPSDGVEFRQSYVVRVNIGGQFTLPAASLETIGSPTRTLRTDQSRIEVKLPDIAAR